MRTIVRIKFGSHLYGTATPASDLDYKSVFVPPAHDILLQRVKGAINTQRPKNAGEKNYAGEIDEEAYSLQRFLSLAAEGQTVALDMLFAPEWSFVEPASAEWNEIIANRHRLLTKKSKAFIGYALKQSAKYGVKGSRVAAARTALALLEAGVAKYGTTAKLCEMASEIEVSVADTEHTSIDQITQIGGQVIDYWNVCGRLLQYTATIKHAWDVVALIVGEYGKRALLAEKSEGVDWKALSHAVRVSTQALELLSTGHVTFPLANASHLVDIKLGRIPYQGVGAEIERLMEKVERAAEVSVLPLEPDYDWIDRFVFRVHRDMIMEGYPWA